MGWTTYTFNELGCIFTLDVHPNGEIRNTKTKRIYKGCYKRGYRFIHIGRKDYRYHRLIAQVYCKKTNINQTEVHHIDGNGENNKANNLQYIIPHKHRELEANKRRTPIISIHKTTKQKTEHKGVRQAAKDLKVHPSAITKALKHGIYIKDRKFKYKKK